MARLYYYLLLVAIHLMGALVRIKAFEIRDLPGLGHVEASDLSDVVVLAGPNGVGKTRLLHAVIEFFRNPQPRQDRRLIFEATSDSERKTWIKSILDTANGDDCEKVKKVLQRISGICSCSRWR